MNLVWVYFTCASRTEARKISKILVKEKLLACANILAPCESIYEWKGKLQRSLEFPVLGKTRASAVKRLTTKILSLHSYDCPSISTAKITDGSPDFLKWIQDQSR